MLNGKFKSCGVSRSYKELHDTRRQTNSQEEIKVTLNKDKNKQCCLLNIKYWFFISVTNQSPYQNGLFEKRRFFMLNSFLNSTFVNLQKSLQWMWCFESEHWSHQKKTEWRTKKEEREAGWGRLFSGSYRRQNQAKPHAHLQISYQFKCWSHMKWQWPYAAFFWGGGGSIFCSTLIVIFLPNLHTSESK